MTKKLALSSLFLSLLAVVLFVVAIWTNDDRWGWTGLATLGASFFFILGAGFSDLA